LSSGRCTTSYNGYTVIFHNGRGYDVQCIVQAIIEGGIAGSQLSVNPTMNGSKIMTMKVTRGKKAKVKNCIRFVDSLNFLTMALKDFTKTFGLLTKKGLYAIFFNTSENAAYRGAMPSKDTFGCDSMDRKTHAEFEKWYIARAKGMSQEEVAAYFYWLDKNDIDRPADVPVWDNAYELDIYCDADVRLLREGCLAFRQVILDMTDGARSFCRVHDRWKCQENLYKPSPEGWCARCLHGWVEQGTEQSRGWRANRSDESLPPYPNQKRKRYVR
jgi:hypothetical protein